jgi:DNA-binding PadR family transcriptional regulator
VANAGSRTDARFLILTSLSSGAKHGYAMVTDIEQFAGVHVGPGTLYTALQRLETDGLIKAVASDDRRRPYRITPAGLTALRTDTEEMRRVARVAGQRLALR